MTSHDHFHNLINLWLQWCVNDVCVYIYKLIVQLCVCKKQWPHFFFHRFAQFIYLFIFLSFFLRRYHAYSINSLSMIKMRLDILSSLSIYIIFYVLIFALLIDNLLFGKKMVDTLVKLIISFIATKDENINNHGYIGTSIL